ncbi:MAG: hypothetical protein U0Q22_08450 [Acidimicrobiales bacterium]
MIASQSGAPAWVDVMSAVATLSATLLALWLGVFEARRRIRSGDVDETIRLTMIMIIGGWNAATLATVINAAVAHSRVLTDDEASHLLITAVDGGNVAELLVDLHDRLERERDLSATARLTRWARRSPRPPLAGRWA